MNAPARPTMTDDLCLVGKRMPIYLSPALREKTASIQSKIMKAHKIEPIKRLVEKATGVGIPTREEALANVRDRNPLHMKFRDDAYIPNNPKLPLLYYRKGVSI